MDTFIFPDMKIISVFCWFTLSVCDSRTGTTFVVREGKEIEGLRLLDFVAFNQMIYFLSSHGQSLAC